METWALVEISLSVDNPAVDLCRNPHLDALSLALPSLGNREIVELDARLGAIAQIVNSSIFPTQIYKFQAV